VFSTPDDAKHERAALSIRKPQDLKRMAQSPRLERRSFDRKTHRRRAWGRVMGQRYRQSLNSTASTVH